MKKSKSTIFPKKQVKEILNKGKIRKFFEKADRDIYIPVSILAACALVLLGGMGFGMWFYFTIK
jgi:preprotein translocase subunit Sss1